MSADDDALEACQWHEPGGRAAAEAIVAFLGEIGIPVAVSAHTGTPFLPGLAVDRGTLQIAPGSAVYPGDLLHEAGHIAVTHPDQRGSLSEVSADPGEEMAAIAWSAAAAAACGIGLEVLFHGAGYKGGSDSLIDAFADTTVPGRGPGVPMLDWYGMTAAAGYPAMARWLR